MCIHALKLTLTKTIEHCTARWIVCDFLEILDVHFNHDATHAHVASDSSSLVLTSLVVKHNLFCKQLDARIAFLSSSPMHEAWLRFIAGNANSLRHSFAKPYKSTYGLKQAAVDWCRLQHGIFMPFDPALQRSNTDPSFYFKVKDGKLCFVIVHVDDYAVVCSDQ